MKYVIEIEQTEGVMNDEFTKRYYELEHITEILLGCNCSTAIDVYPDSVACRLICVKPAGLFIPIYVVSITKIMRRLLRNSIQ